MRNNDEADQINDNTIRFDKLSNFSNIPLNQEFVANED